MNGSGPSADAPPPGAPQAIEAGCSFSSMQIQDAPGASRLVACPPGFSTKSGLWGADVYTGDSGICRAAIHGGFISDAGGMVVVALDVDRPAYRGSARNGITSSDDGNFAKSFRLQRP
ncbi:MAG TPA: LCCL domain-containing protein [Polyangia bacterium]|nr:LCCL domain-containing protein [Polyangia bacterium]